LGHNAGKKLTKSTIKTDIKSDRGWRQIAGPELSSVQLAVVPDGPNCQWKGGEVERIEAKNRAALRAHFAALEQAEVEANGTFTDPGWSEIVSPDGVKCFVARSPSETPVAKPARSVDHPDLLIPDDLSIPAFLLRRGERHA
jgi:hypothetical protein